MKRLRLTGQGLGFSMFCIITTTIHAEAPLWSFSPNGSPVVTRKRHGNSHGKLHRNQ